MTRDCRIDRNGTVNITTTSSNFQATRHDGTTMANGSNSSSGGGLETGMKKTGPNDVYHVVWALSEFFHLFLRGSKVLTNVFSLM